MKRRTFFKAIGALFIAPAVILNVVEKIENITVLPHGDGTNTYVTWDNISPDISGWDTSKLTDFKPMFKVKK